MKSIIILISSFISSLADCITINHCEEQNQNYQQFVSFQIMKCYYAQNNRQLAQTIEELTDEDWLVFTMFMNQYHLLCNYYSFINNINYLTNQISEIENLSTISSQTFDRLKQGFIEMDKFHFDFSAAISICQNTITNEYERLKQYNKIQADLQQMEQSAVIRQNEQHDNLSYLLTLASQLYVIPDNCSQEMLRFYCISFFALALIMKDKELRSKQQQIFLIFILTVIIEFTFSPIINYKYIRFIGLGLAQVVIIRRLLKCQSEPNHVDSVINLIKCKLQVK